MDNKSKNILLLGDGFFARGFLHHINYNKFNITQIYKDSFINPQDIIYNLQRNKKYSSSLHFKDFLYNKLIFKKQMNIDTLNILNKNEVEINKNIYNFDYLVIGLGAQKTLKDWSNEINDLVNKSKLKIGIIGMGPVGFELGNILSNSNNIDMFDILPESKILNYVNNDNRKSLLELLNKNNISTTFEKLYDNNLKSYYNHDKVFMCVGTRANNLTTNLTTNEFLQVNSNNNNYYNIYLGGDAINSPKYIKTGQLAYQQGKYVAERLNNDNEFEYKPNGMALNLGDKKVLIENHKFIPNGIYPDYIIKLYSLFFV
jgi:NADH dehydrogenase FAD-containing subunit